MPEVMEQPMDKPEDSSPPRSQRNTPRDETKSSASTTPSPRKEHAVTTGLSPEKRLGLITAMGQFRPKTATPIQFYNFVREFCIMHNCSIDEAMDRAPVAWMDLSTAQTRLYNSVSSDVVLYYLLYIRKKELTFYILYVLEQYY